VPVKNPDGLAEAVTVTVPGPSPARRRLVGSGDQCSDHRDGDSCWPVAGRTSGICQPRPEPGPRTPTVTRLAGRTRKPAASRPCQRELASESDGHSARLGASALRVTVTVAVAARLAGHRLRLGDSESALVMVSEGSRAKSPSPGSEPEAFRLAEHEPGQAGIGLPVDSMMTALRRSNIRWHW
jgi:hypothetical protein